MSVVRQVGKRGGKPGKEHGKETGRRKQKRAGEGRKNSGFPPLLTLLFLSKHSQVALPSTGRLGNGNLSTGPLQSPICEVVFLTEV